jgi:hypothetical protein
MSTHKYLNYAHISVPLFNDNDMFENCNFARYGNNTEVFANKNLTFINCNLFGCAIPTDAILVDCSIGKCIEPLPQEEPLPSIEDTSNNALILASKATQKFSASLKEKASAEQLEGLINSTDGYKIKVVE